MPAQLNFYKEYPAKPFNIPFEDGDLSRLKFKIRKNVENTDQILSKATDDYILYYFPEFYRHLEGVATDYTNYDVLRATLKNALTIENPGFETKPPSQYKVIITKLNLGRSAYQLRNQYINDRQLPDFQENLDFFNSENNISDEISSQSEFELSNIGDTTSAVAELMGQFSEQNQNYSGAINLGSVDFSFLQTSVLKVISNILSNIKKELEATYGGSYRGNEGDSLTIYFSEQTAPPAGGLSTSSNDPLGIFAIPKIAISGITYMAGDPPTTDFLKVGYFSLIKYKKIFSDQVTLKIIQNYQEMLQQQNQYASTGQQYPMFEFLTQTLPQDTAQHTEADSLFGFPTQQPQGSNALTQEAIRLGLIDVNDKEELKKGVRALTAEEKALLREEVKKNPELYEKVYKEEKKKRLETGVNVADTVGNVLEYGPAGIFQQNSAVDNVLQKLGLKALAKEAMICLTFGLNYEMGRIADVIGDVLQEELNERQSQDSKFDMFMIKGDIWKTVLNVILNSIQKAILQIVMQLADLLKEACNLNNPRADDYGATDLNDLFYNNLFDPEGARDPFGFGNMENSPYGDLSAFTGMSPDELKNYLRDLSSILSSIEICILMLDRGDAPDELLDRIINFNLNYPDPNVSTKLIEYSSVMEFFRLLSLMADVTALCNEIINDLSLLNQDNICLDLDDLDDIERQNIEDLLEIIENGFDQPPPEFSFDCPEKENYINDPVIAKLIPETFSSLIEMVELQFIYSAESIKSILLEPSLGGAEASSTFQTAIAAGSTTGSNPELTEDNQNNIGAIGQLFTDLSESPAREAIETCILDAPGLLAPGVEAIGDAVDALIKVLGNPETQDAITNMVDKIDALGDPNTTPPISGPVVQTYKFNKQFYDRFVNYIKIDTADYIPSTSRKYQIQNYFERYLGSNDEPRIQFSFPTPSGSVQQRIALRYPVYDSVLDPSLDWSIFFNLDELLETEAEEQFGTEISSSEISYNLDLFVDAAKKSVPLHPDTIAGRIFPFAYGLLTDQIFDYYAENGIFDAATLLSLNFFHDNINCAAGDVSDLLDVVGIFRQMQEEYIEEACAEDPAEARNRMREVIKYGMFLLLVQVCVAEFVIKNIFVFAAVQLDDLFGQEFIVSYMRDQINASLTAFFEVWGGRHSEERLLALKESLVEIFNRMMRRESTVMRGGIVDANGNIIFPVGTLFLNPPGGSPQTYAADTPTATFDDIIGYLAQIRIQSSMGTLASPGPVSNAILNALPVSNQKTMEEIFLGSLPLRNIDDESRWILTQAAEANTIVGSMAVDKISTSLNGSSAMFITKTAQPYDADYGGLIFDVYSAPNYTSECDERAAVERLLYQLLTTDWRMYVPDDINLWHKPWSETTRADRYPGGSSTLLTAPEIAQEISKNWGGTAANPMSPPQTFATWTATNDFAYSTTAPTSNSSVPVTTTIDPAAEIAYSGSAPGEDINNFPNGHAQLNQMTSHQFDAVVGYMDYILVEWQFVQRGLLMPLIHGYEEIHQCSLAHQTDVWDQMKAGEIQNMLLNLEAYHDPLTAGKAPFQPETIKYTFWMYVHDASKSDLEPITIPDLPPKDFENVSTYPTEDDIVVGTDTSLPGATAGTPLEARNKYVIKLFEIDLSRNEANALQPGGVDSAEWPYTWAALGLNFAQGILNQTEIDFLLNHPTYKDYFAHVFSQEIIGLVPIIHNFYLTNRYFGDIALAMRTTKARVINILETTINNQDNYDGTPDLSRRGARETALQTELPDPESMAKDFIWKMIFKTPIDIIKGLMEIIDPHVVISKLIKTGSGKVFEEIRKQLAKEELPSPSDSPPGPFHPNADGGDLFVAVICLLDYMMKNPGDNFTGLDPEPENFFPRISEDGVDFLGTGMGMLMIPPTPLGLIYLLLSLINFDTQQPNLDIDVDVVESNSTGDPSEC